MNARAPKHSELFLSLGRALMPSAMPVELAERMSDRQGELDDAADAIEAENRRMAKQNAPKWIADAEFWREELLDSDLAYIADPLAECMANLDEACKGNEFARDRICQALHQIERCATPQAEKQLFAIYGRGE